MKRLTDVPFEALKLGDKILSAINTHGKIIELIPRELTSRLMDNEIVVQWENGNISHFWHFWGCNLQYLELEA